MPSTPPSTPSATPGRHTGAARRARQDPYSEEARTRRRARERLPRFLFHRSDAIELAPDSTIGAITDTLDRARVEQGLSKADLAHAIDVDPASVRRLLGFGDVNPTLRTVAMLAAALDLRLVLEPVPPSRPIE